MTYATVALWVIAVTGLVNMALNIIGKIETARNSRRLLQQQDELVAAAKRGAETQARAADSVEATRLDIERRSREDNPIYPPNWNRNN